MVYRKFKPAKVNVIPLIEDLPSLLFADRIVRLYARAMGLEGLGCYH